MENSTQFNKDTIKDQLKKIIEKKSVKNSRLFLDEYPDANIAEAIEQLPLEMQLFFFRVLRTQDAAVLFSYLEDESQTKLIHCFTEDWGMKILQDLQTDELASALEDLPVNLQKRILANTPAEKRSMINSILSFEETQVGSIMSADLSVLKSNLNCRQALSKIRSDYRKNIEFSHYFYVTDKTGILLGKTTLEEIVFADEDFLIDQIYSPVAKVYMRDNVEDAAKIFSTHDLSSLPVVSNDNRIIGMITSDDVIDVIQDSATEDMYKMAGISPDAAEENYTKITARQIVKSRILWLIILMISATLSQLIIQKFTTISENFINSLGASLTTAIIVALIPVLSGTAGNAGSQSSTTITRAEALGQIDKKHISKTLFKEIRVGLIIGSILFVVNVLRLIVYFSAFGELYGQNTYLPTIFIILASSISIFLAIIFAKILGSIIPLVAIRFKKDPAVMSAPILATLSDAISTIIFFGITILILWLALG